MVLANFPRDENDFTSRDFIDIVYPTAVDGCTSLHIYETFNPGTLDVVYLGKEEGNGTLTWHRVWTYPEPFSIVLSNDQQIPIHDGESGNAERRCSYSFVHVFQENNAWRIYFPMTSMPSHQPCVAYA